MAEIKTTVDTSGAGKLDALPDAMKTALKKEVSTISAMLLAMMRAKASGGVTKVRTGKLSGSFHALSSEGQAGLNASVYSNDPVLNILEHGGVLPPHEIRPKEAHALCFLGTASDVFNSFAGDSGALFRSATYFPGATLDPHSIVNSTFTEEKQEIIDRLESVIEKTTNEAN